MFIKKKKILLRVLKKYDILITKFPGLIGISVGNTNHITHNYIDSIASLVQCCVNLFEDSPINNHYQQLQLHFLPNFLGVPFYIYIAKPNFLCPPSDVLLMFLFCSI